MQFRDQYQFLSNMHEAPIRLSRSGVKYEFKSVEAAFQAYKCPERMGEFQNLTGPQAKALGRNVQLRPDWEEIKVPLMKALISMKFKQHPELKQALVQTGNMPIAEDNNWGDTFWGVVNGQGQNHLGKILMETRAQFQQELQTQSQRRPMSVLYDFDDIYDLPQGPNEILCITTNGVVKPDGKATMGKGIALTANQRFGLDEDLGKLIAQNGNKVFDMGMRTDKQTGRQVHIVTLPTKHHWKDKSDPALIEQSLKEIMALCDEKGYTKAYTTAPGCALGGLDWGSQVKPIMDKIVDDRFIVADWKLQDAYNEAHGIPKKDRTPRPGEVIAAKPSPAPKPIENKGLTLCFTGQRPKDLAPNRPDKYTMAPYQQFQDNLVLYLEDLYNAGYRNFISGGAQGFDQIAFWAVDRLKQTHPDVQNIAYLPFKGQESRWADNGAFGPREYRKMLEKADHIAWTSEMQGIEVDRRTGKNIAFALDKRNHAMVNDADLVIALYRDPQGLDRTKKGSGTNNCMKYAVEHGVPVYQIVYENDQTGAVQGMPQINMIPADIPKPPKKTPMWILAENSTTTTPAQASQGRNMQDINTALQNIQDEPENPADQHHVMDI